VGPHALESQVEDAATSEAITRESFQESPHRPSLTAGSLELDSCPIHVTLPSFATESFPDTSTETLESAATVDLQPAVEIAVEDNERCSCNRGSDC
jgi:hypothetical protein